MKRLCVLAVATWLAVGAGSARAQFWNPFRKSPPPAPPAERVSAYVTTIKSDPDERKRLLAVEGLREFDVKTFPEIVPVLADVAQSDPKPGVRAEAVSSLVRIRPVTPLAGQAIEHAAAKDENWRNRMNAQAALVRYRLAGYSSTMPAPGDVKQPQGTASAPQSKEPPINDRPPVIYYDQHGKVIPPPKNLPGPMPGPVNGIPVSNPKKQPPFKTIGPATPAPVGPAPVVPSNPPQFAPNQMLPTPPAPVTPAPVAVEPVFRNVNKLPTAPAAIGTPTNVVPPAGPTLDLPPLPINGVPTPTPAPTPAPTPTPTPQGPSLESSTSGSSPLPSGRMEPSPRLEPAP